MDSSVGRYLLKLLMTALAVALQACVTSPLRQEDSAKICRVAVEIRPDALAFEKNPLAGTVSGPILGTAAGALLVFYTGPLAIAGPVAGVYCGISATKYPEGEAAFRDVFEKVEPGGMKRALDHEFAKRLADCRRARPEVPAGDAPDTVVHIEKIEYRWNCPHDRQFYMVNTKWRAQSADGSSVYADFRTQCFFESSRSVLDWSADPSYARLEAALALAKSGERIAREIIDLERPPQCRHVLDESAVTGTN